jgi:hypothetical protein
MKPKAESSREPNNELPRPLAAEFNNGMKEETLAMPRIPLGPGELAAPARPTDSLFFLTPQCRQAWHLLIETIRQKEKLNHQMLHLLAEGPLSAFREAVRSSPRLQDCPSITPDELRLHANQGQDVALVALHKALESWCEYWQMPAEGMRFIALMTLSTWSHDPKQAGRKWCYPEPNMNPFPADHGTLDVLFYVPGWHPETEQRGIARKRMLRIIEAQLDNYLTKREQIYREMGAVPVAQKTNEEHFAFFVQHQIMGESLSQIGRKSRTDRTAVSRAVDSIGELLDKPNYKTWKRPILKGGRPRRQQ